MNSSCGLIPEEIKMQTYSYAEYLELTKVASNVVADPSDVAVLSRVMNTRLNVARMKRLEKVVAIGHEKKQELAALQKPQCWTVITETWCGDSAQNVPSIVAVANASAGKIRLQFVLRDTYPEFIDRYSVNGVRSIPKLVARNLSGDDIFTWGPRPATAARMMTEWKANPGERSKEEVINEMHRWYAKNRGREVVSELMDCICAYEEQP